MTRKSCPIILTAVVLSLRQDEDRLCAISRQRKLKVYGSQPEAPVKKSAVGKVDPAEMPVALCDDAPLTIDATREIQKEMMPGMNDEWHAWDDGNHDGEVCLGPGVEVGIGN